MERIAVVLFNLGGPDSLDAVQPFLENLFNDPDIFKLPFQKFLARFISQKRAPKVQEEYRLIGGKSPLSMYTEKQRCMLEKSLRLEFPEIDVFTAMRYWTPLTAETANKVAQGNYDRVILLPLYPHYSISTTGSSYNEWNRHYKLDPGKVSLIHEYATHPLYIRALNERIEEGLELFLPEERPRVQLVFSAHGTPVSFVKKGDPYSLQIEDTVNAVMAFRHHEHEHHLCFQSKVGPAKWLEPSTESTILKLAENKKNLLLIIPVSFVSDHVETLYELAIEYKHVADSAGIQKYFVMPGLNESKLFIQALTDIVKTKLNY
ncbi:MAG: ferrochelatase [Ignavibacteria bacterium]|nr:ferrochelatase [Ignavibacteria bacterium]